MNKIFKYAFAAVACLIAFATTSCSSSDDYEMAEKLSGAQVYFPNTLVSKVNLSAAENSYSIPLYRVKTDGELTVPLAVDYTGEGLTFPASVTFADGKNEADIVVSYDVETLGFDNFQKATIAIDNKDYTTIYGATVYEGSFGVPAPWTSLGKAVIYEGFWEEMTYTAEIQQNDIDPQTFRIINPFPADVYAQGSDMLEFRIYHAGETLQGEVLTQDIVYWDYHCAGMVYHSSYDDIVTLVWPGTFTKYPTQDAWVHNTVLAYQENGLPATVQFAPFYYMFSVGGWDYTQNDGMFTITFPGVEIKDYSVAVDYTGKFYDTEDAVYAVASVELGEDVTSAKVGVIEGADPADLVNGLADGSIEGVEVTKNGEVKVAMPENAKSGKYTIAIVSFDANGEAQEYDYVTFKYTDLSAPTVSWDLTKTLVGDYEYVQYFEGTDPGLVLTPKGNGKFTISEWGYGVDFNFTLHEDNTITFDDFWIGDTHPTYGQVMLADLNSVDDEEEAPSYYDPNEGVFYFNTYYYVEAGYFGYGPETFTITGYADAAAKKNAAKKSSAKKGGMKKANHKVSATTVRKSNIKIAGKGKLVEMTKASLAQ